MNILKNLLSFLSSQNKHIKSFIVFFLDCACFLIAYIVFMFSLYIWQFEMNLDLPTYLLLFLPIFSYVFVVGLQSGYNEVFRNFGITSLIPLITGSVIFFISLLVTTYYVFNDFSYYAFFQTALAITSMSFLMISLLRVGYRIISSDHYINKTKNIFIYGIGKSAQELYSSLSFNSNYSLGGFLSADKNYIGRELNGLQIISLKQAKTIWNKIDNPILYIASRSLVGKNRNKLIESCVAIGVEVKEISTYSEMLKEKQVELKDLSISDILPRSNIDTEIEGTDLLTDKTILITGAGGSIGSEIARIVSTFKTRKLIILDLSEPALFNLFSEISESAKNIELIPILLDIKNKADLDKLLQKYKPDIIYHAAAYKHVPILEDIHNYKQAFENNFFGTCNIVDLAVKNNVKSFIFVSTDKAVRPTNLMGASKRLSELYIQTANKNSSVTSLRSVRFGNVMNSSGSVVPIFRRQIKNGGPVTVTHPDVTRYFMTIEEAASLVILTSTIKRNNGVYMLKMGSPVKISDIARRMIALSGNEIRSDNSKDGIEIIYTGLRPGEKLYEELLVKETDAETNHPKIFVDTNSRIIEEESFDEIISRIKSYLNHDEIEQLKLLLKELTEYHDEPNGS